MLGARPKWAVVASSGTNASLNQSISAFGLTLYRLARFKATCTIEPPVLLMLAEKSGPTKADVNDAEEVVRTWEAKVRGFLLQPPCLLPSGRQLPVTSQPPSCRAAPTRHRVLGQPRRRGPGAACRLAEGFSGQAR